MSTHTPPMSAPPATAPQEIVIVSHSNLFYWWPVWALGFILFLLTWLDGHLLAIVPKDTVAASNRRVEVEPGKEELRNVLIAPAGDKGTLLADPANPGVPAK